MASGWEYIVNEINQKGFTKYAELGVQSGLNIKNILTRCKLTHILAVDYWDSQADLNRPKDAGSWVYKEWKHDANYQKFLQRVKPFEGRVSMVIVKAFTHDASQNVMDGFYDMVFIDADHSYDGCSLDIKDWAPKVRCGGILCGHDYDWPGVNRAVKQLIPGYRILGGKPEPKKLGVTGKGEGMIWAVEMTSDLVGHIASVRRDV